VSQVQVQLPESLQLQLEERAQREGISLQEYIVYSLTRVMTIPDLMEQRRAFDEMLTRYRADEAESALQNLLSARK
jgi:hypothetical protein